MLAGHIDTVPLTKDPANLPTRRDGDELSAAARST